MSLTWPWRCHSCAQWRITQSCRPCQSRIALEAFQRVVMDFATEAKRITREELVRRMEGMAVDVGRN